MKMRSIKTINHYTGSIDDLFEKYPRELLKHCRRVAVCCSIITGYMNEGIFKDSLDGYLNTDVIAHLTGTFHDIGKMFFLENENSNEAYLNHPKLGAEFLSEHKKKLFDDDSQARYVIEAVKYHHERPDGKGFPYRLKEDEIPLLAGICAVADKIDKSLYIENKPAICEKRLLCEIKSGKGVLFTECVVTSAEKAFPRIIGYYRNWNQGVRKKY